MRRTMVLTSVKTLIWLFAASTLGPKQSDEVVGLYYSLDPCFKKRRASRRERDDARERRADCAVC